MKITKTPSKSATSRADRRAGALPAFALPNVFAGRGSRILRTGAWVLLHTTVIGGVAGGLWWHHINEVPTITVPPVTLPSPNGYVALVNAVGKLQHEKEIGYAIADPKKAKVHHTPGVKEDRDYTWAEKARLIADNADLLRDVRAAFPLPSHAPLVRDWATTFPECAKFRSVARLMLVEGQVYENQQQYGKAANTYVDIMQLGERVGHGGVLIHKLVSIACEAIGRRGLLQVSDKLTAPEACDIIKRLEVIHAQRAPMSEALTEEKWFSQAGLDKEFKNHNLWQVYSSFITMANGTDTPPPPFSDKLKAVGLMLRYSKTDIARANATYMDQIIADASLPYDRSRPEAAAPPDLLNQILFPVFTQAIHKEADTNAQDALLMTKLALQAYQAGHNGQLPENLDALVQDLHGGDLLVPGYLKAVPVDPFAKNGTDTLRYKRTSPTTYTLYSVGPDGVDNNGTPIPPSKTNKNKRWTDPLDNGDFVLGVNYY